MGNFREHKLREQRYDQSRDQLVKEIQQLASQRDTINETLKIAQRELNRLDFIFGRETEEVMLDGRKRRPMSAEARKKISDKQRQRWAKRSKTNLTSPDWSPQEDKEILSTVKSMKESVSLSKLSEELSDKLRGRSTGAIKQHVVKLAQAGELKARRMKNGSGVARVYVEAAA